MAIQLERLAAAPSEPVSLAEVKAALRLTYDSEDAVLAGLITAAREGVEAELGVSLAPTRWREVRDGFAPADGEGALGLLRGPLISVETITAADPSGAAQTLDPRRYRVLAGRPGRVAPVAQAWPHPGVSGGGVVIDYTAGFDPAPEPLRQAVVARAAWRFLNREAAPPPDLAEGLLAPFRLPRL